MGVQVKSLTPGGTDPGCCRAYRAASGCAIWAGPARSGTCHTEIAPGRSGTSSAAATGAPSMLTASPMPNAAPAAAHLICRCVRMLPLPALAPRPEHSCRHHYPSTPEPSQLR